MREATIKIFTFDELPDNIQRSVHENFWQTMEYPWQGEVEDTLDAFTDLFDFSVYHWEYNSMIASHRESFPDYYHEIKGHVAREWFKRQSKIIYDDECPLTGFYLDSVIVYPIRLFIDDTDRIDSVADILRLCVGDFFSAVVQDVEYYYSFESCSEHCAMNEYEFLDNGEFYK